MIALDSAFQVGLYENGGRRLLGGDQQYELTRNLLDRGYSVSIIRSENQIERIQKGALLLLGHFEKEGPLPAIGNGNGVELYFQDIHGMETRQILDAVEAVRGETGPARPGRLETLVSGDRLQPLHQLHAVPELLSV